MKYLIPLAFFIVGISAWPQISDVSKLSENRFITDEIAEAINDASQAIKDAGFDPYILERESAEYALPVPVLFNAAAFIEDVLSFGLSDIRINSLNYSVLLFRLTFDIELPHIHLSIGDSYAKVTLFGDTLDASLSGSVDINNINVIGTVQIRLGIISGIYVQSVSIDFNLRSVDSHLNVTVSGTSLSDFTNGFIGGTIPETLRTFKSDLDRLLEIVIFDIIDANL